MTIYLKQSTASQEVPLGYFLDSTDGNTEETALTIANTDIKVWKTGATTLADKNSGGATHISNGIYYATLDATDTNTLGPLVIFVHVAGALAVRLECCVLAANVYDSLIGGGDLLQVDTTQIGGTAQTAGDVVADTNDIQSRLPAALVSGRMDASVGAMAANVVTASAVASDAVTEIQSGLATAASLATVDGKADAILADTSEIGVAGVGLTALASAANLAVVAGYLDTEVAAIKAQTDKLTFNASNAVAANITHVIDDAVQQNGSTSTNWGGAP